MHLDFFILGCKFVYQRSEIWKLGEVDNKLTHVTDENALLLLPAMEPT